MADFNVINEKNGDFEIKRNTLGKCVKATRRNLLSSLENLPPKKNVEHVDGEKKALKDVFSVADKKTRHRE